ncbi:PTS cellobiose transporter subunit IIC [Pediococcus acidilactici]|uniref:PTS cellobiose transporter subunit IIC n=1 Tax=Pediococcus acidilactici TaxID=1254 RepID=UPI0013211859|nr:PTS cellobiose transporter subunit IIC [Pediococcus acidilactici]KAF0464613.1 PTS cellobiose transporter subunit IIC [Pediococcus acidilactici]KAF0471140.1 PTS cellobiose transporter subunit IIC [Pediococcus acidilactici]KAF0489384.1 PTS cellobiose transporter subunit IIC [Pediococcus acidilactici]KAF0525294.1 PTS cellobiose transporter subunit IIC [Pediococcus acidilactici]KAF0796773.1 PTS cellobiose transporter subunit IIC [Pediococcus acidilactici]
MGDNNKTNGFAEKLMPLASKVASSRHLVALRDGFALVMPLIIIGSVFMIISQFPIPAYLNMMTSLFGAGWQDTVGWATNATFSIIGMVAVIGISFELAKSYDGIDAISASMVSLAAFMLTIPLNVDKAGAVWVPLTQLGSMGLFEALLIGLFITDAFVWMIHKDWQFKMPDTVPPAVGHAFSSLIPGFVIILGMWLLRLLVSFTDFKTIPNVITVIVSQPLNAVGGSIFGMLVAEFFVVFLWLFGIHGSNVVGGIMAPVWLGKMAENADAAKAHKALPNIVTQQFVDNFIHFGGAGETLALAFMLMFLAKSENFRAIGKLTAIPGLFNINEPIIFGVPMVLNPVMAIPFVIVPLISVVTTYYAMKFGLVAKPLGIAVPWTTPPLISGYLATGKISGAVIQLVNLAIGGLVYYPFFKIADRQALQQEEAKRAEMNA